MPDPCNCFPFSSHFFPSPFLTAVSVSQQLEQIKLKKLD
uniref:Uncharacterized protein n=1 Tax=Arundo donax TaxID=35708 RepID=A0A0A9F4I8_ARUDO